MRPVLPSLALPAHPDYPLVRTRYPVVLVHGFGSLGTVGKPGLLHHQARFLRLHGTLAYAPNVAPYDTTAVRAQEWLTRLDRIVEEAGAEKVNLIGYSAGGLDARFLASRCGLQDRIASVITVNTPHRGSELATWTLQESNIVKQVALGVMDVSGRIFYEREPRVTAGLRELTPEYLCDEFNPKTPDVAGIYYASWAGAAGKGTETRISTLLLIQNRILYDLAGVNDGMVTVESARWGDFRGVVAGDHLTMAGVGPGSRRFSRALFLNIARHLAARGL